MWLFRLLFKPVGFVLAGLAIAVVGGGLAYNGRTDTTPERAELTKTEGTVKQVMMTWKEKFGTKRNIKFEIEVVTKDGKSTTYKVPDERLTEDQASSIDGNAVTVLTRGDSSTDVWEIESEGTKIIDYAASRQEHVESLAFQAETGPYIGGGGVLLLLVGALRMMRRKQAEVPTV